jgi:hypothetical protein
MVPRSSTNTSVALRRRFENSLLMLKKRWSSPLPLLHSHCVQQEMGDDSMLHIIIFDELDAIMKTRGSTRSPIDILRASSL